MTTVSHDRPVGAEPRSPLTAVLGITQMWAGLAIIAIWVSVLFAAVYGPDIDSRSVAGDTTSIPSGVAIALFAAFATWKVAKYGFTYEDRRVTR